MVASNRLTQLRRNTALVLIKQLSLHKLLSLHSYIHFAIHIRALQIISGHSCNRNIQQRLRDRVGSMSDEIGPSGDLRIRYSLRVRQCRCSHACCSRSGRRPSC